jgi:hypothetical protein
LQAILLTRSEEGMTLFDADGELHVSAQAREVFDVTGAGDTVIATMASLVAAGMGLRDAVPIANRPAVWWSASSAPPPSATTNCLAFIKGRIRMTRIVVTGAAGFIGSNIIKGLNARGIDDIIAVDDLQQGDKFRNLASLRHFRLRRRADLLRRLCQWGLRPD